MRMLPARRSTAWSDPDQPVLLQPLTLFGGDANVLGSHQEDLVCTRSIFPPIVYATPLQKSMILRIRSRSAS